MLDSNDPRLTAYALGQLDDEEQKQIEVELKKSPELQQQVDQIRSLGGMLREAKAPTSDVESLIAESSVAESPAVESPVAAAVEERLSESPSAAPSTVPRTDRTLAKWIAMAASILPIGRRVVWAVGLFGAAGESGKSDG